MLILLAWLFTAPPIQLLVYPSVALAPATIRIQVRMQPVATDRLVRVVADAEAFYRSSEWEIEGDRAPRLTPRWAIVDVPAGEYTIVATIGSRTQMRARDTRIVEVH